MWRVTRVVCMLAEDVHRNFISRYPQNGFPSTGLEFIASRGSSSQVSPDRKSHYQSMVDRMLYLTTPYPRSANARISSVGVTDGGKNVEIVWNDGVTSRYHSLWLKHGCHCPSCRLSTNQPVVSFQHMDMDVTVKQAEKEGEELLRVTWSDDSSHTGLFPLPFLKEKDYSAAAQRERKSYRKTVFKHKDSVPEMNYDDIMTSEQSLYRWLRILCDYGICIIKNVPAKSHEVKKVAERISVIQASDTDSEVFEVLDLPNPNSFAYTTRELALHMDLPIYESPPGIQLLHCIRFDKEVTGGESVYVDFFHVISKFRETHPREFRDLARIPASWETVFYSGERPQHRVYKKQHISLDHDGEVIGVRWHPATNEVLQTNEEDIEPYYKAYKALETMIKTFPLKHKRRFQQGELLSINNRRWLHGRTAYDGSKGVRHLQGCYVQIDEFMNRVQLYSNTIGDGKLSTQVGNDSCI